MAATHPRRMTQLDPDAAAPDRQAEQQNFGTTSEKVEREIEQLELALEELQVAAAERDTSPTDGDEGRAAHAAEPAAERAQPAAVPACRTATPRERRELDPGDLLPRLRRRPAPRRRGHERDARPDRGAAEGRRDRRGRRSPAAAARRWCRPRRPSRPIPRSMAGAGLLAHILVSKFDDHMPLYRQNEIFARMGADIPDSTLVDWCGRAMKVLSPAGASGSRPT